MDRTRQKIEQFASPYPLQQLAARMDILDSHSQPKGIFWLIDGKVRQYTLSPEGEELTVHLFESGSFFPLTWALNHIPNRYTYQTVTSCQLRVLPVDEFVTFIKDQPELLLKLSQRLLFGLDGLLLRVESLSLQNAHKRVASVLWYLARHFGQMEGQQIIFRPHLTHREIATYTGLARETTSVEMSKLEKQGIIGYDGATLIIRQPASLEALLEQSRTPHLPGPPDPES